MGSRKQGPRVLAAAEFCELPKASKTRENQSLFPSSTTEGPLSKMLGTSSILDQGILVQILEH